MQYDKTRIAIRERDLPDLLDLALHLVRAHWLALLLASVVGGAPFDHAFELRQERQRLRRAARLVPVAGARALVTGWAALSRAVSLQVFAAGSYSSLLSR